MAGPAEPDDIDALISGLRTGETGAVRRFCALYGPSLQRLADHRMADGLRHRTGPEDVMQSVYRTFFRRAADGQFEFDDAGALWRLLCAITLTKVREKARFHLRQRRGVNREVMIDSEAGSGFQLGASDADPADLAILSETMTQLLESLDAEEQRVVDLKLQDLPNHEVAARLGCSERTVRRVLGRLRQRFKHVFDEA